MAMQESQFEEALPPVTGTHDKIADVVYCYQPCYGGGGHPASVKAFLTQLGEKHSRSRILVSGGGSLLANAFNQGIVHAINLQAKDNITHWYIQHGDVIPDSGVLDTLLKDMKEHNADIMSAVVPIKDPFGLTSTAIDNPDDKFNVIRRLTMHEVMQLPPVFTAKDCGYPDHALLINTGCLLIKFTEDWRQDICFTINDRVSYDIKKGQFVSEVAPEDWNFSRWAHARGLKVMATRNPGLDHVGEIRFSNREDWGVWRYDNVLAHNFGAEPIKPTEVVLPDAPTRGWLSKSEGGFLAEITKDKMVLEIGSYCGRSTVFMAKRAAHVFAVDTFDGRGTASPRDTLREFTENLKRYGLYEKVTIVQGKSADVVPSIPLMADYSPFDIVFIDGSHAREDVITDILVSLPLLADDGVLAFHDYRSVHDPEVTQVIDCMISQMAVDVIGVCGTVIVLKRRPSLCQDTFKSLPRMV